MNDSPLTDREIDHQQKVWEENKNGADFLFLLPYPRLLFKWSLRKDYKEIAKITSHMRGAHRYCSKVVGVRCNNFEYYLKNILLKQFLIILKYRMKITKQQSFEI